MRVKFQIGELAIATLGPRGLHELAVGLFLGDLGLINRTLKWAGLPTFETIEDAKTYLPSPETLEHAANFKFKTEFVKGW